MLLPMLYAPTDISPPNRTNWLFMKMTMTQAQAFIKNGDIPMDIMFFTKLAFSLYMPRFKCNSSFLLQ